MATLTIDPTTASAVALIRRPRWVMHRRVPSARCSATHRTGSGLLATWPANDWSFPLVVARRRSWGSRADAVPFAGLIPLTGWTPASSAGPGPRVVVAFASAPIGFRRGDPLFRSRVGSHVSM
jgi:hypothetical protein